MDVVLKILIELLENVISILKEVFGLLLLIVTIGIAFAMCAGNIFGIFLILRKAIIG